MKTQFGNMFELYHYRYKYNYFTNKEKKLKDNEQQHFDRPHWKGLEYYVGEGGSSCTSFKQL